ncbi:hypothetical protein OG21DRAFT_665290 [Imleria badia]|nr:hypothetical protein OG21DRAFT_665290 [Imleria badia]
MERAKSNSARSVRHCLSERLCILRIPAHARCWGAATMVNNDGGTTFVPWCNRRSMGTLYPLVHPFSSLSNGGSSLYRPRCTILGRRVPCQTAILATAIGTLLCGISGSMVELTVARFIPGMCGGVVQLLAMIITAVMYSILERGLPQAFTNMSQGLGLGLGGPIGGVLSDMYVVPRRC